MFRSYDHLQQENILLARITQLTTDPLLVAVPANKGHLQVHTSKDVSLFHYLRKIKICLYNHHAVCESLYSLLLT
jgi:nucleoid-associated protein YejK